MIKFLLIFIAAILVMLGIYSYTNQESKKPVLKSSIPEKKIEVTETEKVLTQPKVVKVKKRVTESLTVNPPKVISHEETKEMEDKEGIGKGLMLNGNQNSVADFSKIGEGLTLEGIENSDVSEHEKNLMLDDLAAYQSYRGRNNPSISKEEGTKALTKKLN